MALAGPQHALTLRSKGQIITLKDNIKKCNQILHSPGVGLHADTTTHKNIGYHN